MHWKISPKDFVTFVIFCVFLLYLCAIGVLNFATFGQTGEFYGLSPFRAFTPEYLPITLILFFVLLGLIFSSVSGYIFSKDKSPGFGLEFGEKQEKGYSRWATDKEIKNDKDVESVSPTAYESDVAGIPLINNGKNISVDNGEYHNLVIGAT